MSVIFDEVVTEIEPAASSRSTSSLTQPEAESWQVTLSDQELAQRITRLQERQQRLMAD